MKYVIVGAGPSGLTLAYVLAINNIPITIIENSNQLGGSWNSQWIDDKYFSENSPRVMVHNKNQNDLLNHVGMTDCDFANIYGDVFQTNLKMMHFLINHFSIQDYFVFIFASVKYTLVKEKKTVKEWLDESFMSASGKKAMSIISILLCDRPEKTNVCDLFGMFGFSPSPLKQMREPNQWHGLIQYYIRTLPNVTIVKNTKVTKLIHRHDSSNIQGVVVHNNYTHVQSTIYADNVVLCTQSSGLLPILEGSDNIIRNNWLPYDEMKIWGKQTYYCGFGFQLHYKNEVRMPEKWCWSCMGDWTVIVLPVSNWLKRISNDPSIKTVWSCCIVDMDTKSRHLQKTANECTDHEEVVYECLRQMNEQHPSLPAPDVATTSVGLYHSNGKWISENTGYTQSKYGNIQMKGNMKNLYALGCFTETGISSVATMGKAIDATALFLNEYEPNLQHKVFL